MEYFRDLTTGKETLYVVGGYKDSTSALQDAFFKYDFDNDEWTSIAKFRKPDRGAYLFQYKGNILAIGGNDNDKSLDVSTIFFILN